MIALMYVLLLIDLCECIYGIIVTCTSHDYDISILFAVIAIVIVIVYVFIAMCFPTL